jgi:hypothetical protein
MTGLESWPLSLLAPLARVRIDASRADAHRGWHLLACTVHAMRRSRAEGLGGILRLADWLGGRQRAVLRQAVLDHMAWIA